MGQPAVIQEPLHLGFGDQLARTSDTAEKQNEPPYPTAFELADLLTAFQRAIYGTVAFQEGLPNARHLTRRQRDMHSLVVVGHDEGSWHLLLQAASNVDPWVVWGTIVATLQLLISIGQGLKVDERHASMTQSEFADMVKTGIRRNHSVEASYKRGIFGENIEFKSTPDDNQRILARVGQDSVADEQLSSVAMQQPERWDAPYWYQNGRIERVEHVSHILHIQFPEYSHSTPCQYDRVDPRRVHAFREGETISIYGRALRYPGDRPDFPPRSIRIIDFSEFRISELSRY